MSATEEPSSWVEVDGYRVAVQITGSGLPPVVLLSSSGGAHEQWDDADGAGILLPRQRSQQELLDNPPPRPRRAVVVSRAFGTVSAEIVARAWQPLTVEEVDQGWRVCQREWALRLGAVHIAADHAGHHVQIDQPALVRYVLDAVVTAARTATDLRLDPDEIRATGGRRLEVTESR